MREIAEAFARRMLAEGEYKNEEILVEEFANHCMQLDIASGGAFNGAAEYAEYAGVPFEEVVDTLLVVNWGFFAVGFGAALKSLRAVRSTLNE